MSEIRIKTIKKELIALFAEIECLSETAATIDVGNFLMDDDFKDKWDDMRASTHTIKLMVNRISKQVKDCEKSIENKKDIEVIEISV